MKKKIAAALVMGLLSLGITTSTPAAAETDEYFFVTDETDIRLQPSEEGAIIENISFGDQVYPLEAGAAQYINDYALSVYNEQLGYINSSCIEYGLPEVFEFAGDEHISTIEEEHIGVPAHTIRSLGYYKVTTYCSCEKCCGKGGGKVTASGTTPTVGRTVGCNWLPLGTHVLIEGHEYIVEDRGARWVKGFDIFWGDDHNAALHSGFGRKIEIFIIE